MKILIENIGKHLEIEEKDLENVYRTIIIIGIAIIKIYFTI